MSSRLFVTNEGRSISGPSGGTFGQLNVSGGGLEDIGQGRLRVSIPDPVIVSSLLTTSAVAALLRRIPIEDSSVKLLRFLVKVQNASGSIYGEFEVKAAYHRVAGVLDSLYAPIVTPIVRSDGGLNVTVTANGNTDVDLDAVGLAATKLTWTAVEQVL